MVCENALRTMEVDEIKIPPLSLVTFYFADAVVFNSEAKQFSCALVAYIVVKLSGIYFPIFFK